MRNILIKFSYQLSVYLLLPILLFQCGLKSNSNETPTPIESATNNIRPEVTDIMIDKAKSNGYKLLADILHTLHIGSQETITNNVLVLYQALDLGDIEIINVLLTNRIGDVTSKNQKGQTPLHIAVIKNNEELVSYLIQQGASVDAQDEEGKTPLRWATRAGYLEVVKLLISAGANLYTADNQRRTPIQGAAAYDHIEIIDILLEAIEKQTDSKTQSLSATGVGLVNHWLPQLQNLCLKKEGYVKILNILEVVSKHGINIIPETETDQQRLITIANLVGKVELAEYVADRIEIGKKDHRGRTQLHRAVKTGDVQLVQQLLEKKARIDIQDMKGKTPLHLACSTGYVEIVKLLIAHKADINTKDHYGNRPITKALIKEHLEVLRILEAQEGKLMFDKRILDLIFETRNAEIKKLLAEGASMTCYCMGKSTSNYKEYPYIKMCSATQEENQLRIDL